MLRFILLFLSILSSSIYINQVITDSINARLHPFGTEEDAKNAIKISKFKLILLTISALLWAITFNI